MIGFDLRRSEYYHVPPRLETLRRHVQQGVVCAWHLDACIELADDVYGAIQRRRVEQKPAALQLYQVRRQINGLIDDVLHSLELQGKLPPEGL